MPCMADFVATIFVLFVVAALFIFVFILAPLMIVGTVILWFTGAKDFAELGRRFDENTARIREANRQRRVQIREANLARRARRLEQRREHGFAPTLRGRLSLEWWRLKKSFAHPIRYFVRGEFRFPPKEHPPPNIV
jgi:hypothetical protein